MANQYTASFQIASFKRRGWIPSSTGLTDADVLALFTEEARVYIASLLKSVREEYLVRESNHDVTIVAGTSQYRIPPRAIGGALRSVHILNGHGDPTPLTRVEPESAYLYPGTGSPAGYMLRGGMVQLLPTPQGGGTLRIGYLQRPSTVVAGTAACIISSINTGAKSVALKLASDETTTTLPSTFASATAFDFVRGSPNFEALAVDQTITNITGNVITFTNTLPGELAVGDYVALAGETPIPQVPVECHALLAQRVVCKLFEATDSPRLGGAMVALEGKDGNGGMRADVMRLLSPRVTASARPIINRNGPGMRRRW